MADFCLLTLTCADGKEADKIADALLKKRLIACAKQLPVTSKFLWKGKIDKNEESLLIMESRMKLFEEVESEVTKLHSYETFVLEAVPVLDVSPKAKEWMSKEIVDA